MRIFNDIAKLSELTKGMSVSNQPDNSAENHDGFSDDINDFLQMVPPAIDNVVAVIPWTDTLLLFVRCLDNGYGILIDNVERKDSAVVVDWFLDRLRIFGDSSDGPDASKAINLHEKLPLKPKRIIAISRCVTGELAVLAQFENEPISESKIVLLDEIKEQHPKLLFQFFKVKYILNSDNNS